MPSELTTIVRRVWYLDVPAPGRDERILPIPYVHVIVNLGDPYRVVAIGEDAKDEELAAEFVSGLQTSVVTTRNPSRLHHVGAELQPWAWRAFAAPPIAGAVEPGSRALPGLAGLREELIGAGGPHDCVAGLIDRLVALAEPSRVDAVIARAGARIAEDPARLISDIARECRTPASSLARRFRAATGITAKSLASVHRLHGFVSRLAQPGPLPTWTELVADAPFCDQPHFNRQFRALTGMTPGAYLAALGESGRAAPSFVNGTVG